jgi:hypothetical protein
LNHCISQGLDDRVINKKLTPRERMSSRFDESVTDLRKVPKWRDASYNVTDPERKIVFRRIQQDIIE